MSSIAGDARTTQICEQQSLCGNGNGLFILVVVVALPETAEILAFEMENSLSKQLRRSLHEEIFLMETE